MPNSIGEERAKALQNFSATAEPITKAISVRAPWWYAILQGVD
jgi:hypothetical protein